MEFTNFLDRISHHRLKILVVGDAMIDEFYHVNVTRISPEFPIPVNKSSVDWPSHSLPGGSANAVFQFKNFNVDARLAAFMDDDSERVFKSHGINTELCLKIYQKIPRKRRFYDGDFPLFRWDIESKNLGNSDLLYENVVNSSWKPDVIIFSDYDKGTFSKNVEKWMTLKGLKIVDPKKSPIDKWQGCDIFKPNMIEAKEMTGCDNPSLILNKLCEIFPEVIVTDGGNGVHYIDTINGFSRHVSYNKVNVQSVSGAGDCFAAFLAMTKGLGYSTKESIEIAYEAGAIYVQRKHNSPLHPLDLNCKIVKTGYLNDRNFGLTFTNGCFDILHLGHIQTLKFAKSQGHKLVVALNSDNSVRRLKGETRPINSLEYRMNMIASLECVDYVVSFDEDTPYEIIKNIKPNILVKAGYNYKDIVGVDIVDKTIIAPIIEGISTTKILEKL